MLLLTMNIEQILSFAERIIEAEPNIINELKVCRFDAYGCAMLLDTISSIPPEQTWASLMEAENKTAFYERWTPTGDLSQYSSLKKRPRSATENDSESPSKIVIVDDSATQVNGPDLGSPNSTEEYGAGCTVSKVLFPAEPDDAEDVEVACLGLTDFEDPSTAAVDHSIEGPADHDDAGVFPFTYSSFPPSCSPPKLPQTMLAIREPVISTEVSSVAKDAASDPLGLSSWPGLMWSRTHVFNLPCPSTVRRTADRPGSFVLYLVQSAFRVADNLALAAAAALAEHLGKPLVAMALLDADCCNDVAKGRLSACTTMQSPMEQPRARVNTVTPLRPASGGQRPSSASSPSAAEAAFLRKSDRRIGRALAMERALAAAGVPFFCEVFADALDRQSVVDTAVSSAAVVCTDTYLHPTAVRECHRLRGSHPEVPLFAADSNSLLLHRKPAPGAADQSGESTGADVPDWLSLDIFEALLDEALEGSLSRGEALDRSRTEWRECHRAVVRMEAHSKEMDASGAAGALRRRIADRRSVSVRDMTTWSELVAQCGSGVVDEWPDASTCAARVRRSIDCEEGRSSAVLAHLSAEVRDMSLSGLLSPLQLEDLLDAVQQRATSGSAGEPDAEAQRAGASRLLLRLLRQDLLSAEYARHICSSSGGFASSATSESVRNDNPSVNWLGFLPTSAVERVQDWFVDAKSRVSGHLLYPDALRRGCTGHDLFDAIQRRLVLGGEVPSGDSMRLWILYLVRHLPSFETAVRVALTEIATYCVYDLSTADSDGSYIIPLILMQGIVDCMEHLGTSRDSLDEGGKGNAVDPAGHIRRTEAAIRSKDAVLR